jgi:DNA-directed RNA polymerase specialized sigma24 family protein
VQIQHEKGECRVVRYNLAAMIAMLLAEGKTQEEAAAILGVDQSTVSRRKPRGGARACRRSMQKPRLVHNAA